MKKQTGFLFSLCGRGEKIRQLLVETQKVSSVMNNNFKSIFLRSEQYLYANTVSEGSGKRLTFS